MKTALIRLSYTIFVVLLTLAALYAYDRLVPPDPWPPWQRVTISRRVDAGYESTSFFLQCDRKQDEVLLWGEQHDHLHEYVDGGGWR